MKNGITGDSLWEAELPDAVQALRSGGVLLYPTDTIWGLGCDAMDETAIRRIYEIKKRPPTAPLIVLVDSIEMLHRYARRIHPRVETLLSLHTKPLTIIYPDVHGLPGILYSEKKMVAIRVIQEPFCQALIAGFGRPIVSTSANLSGEPWPKGFGEISSEVIRNVNYVVKYRRNEKNTGEPSVIATYNSKGNLDFLRE